MSHGRRIAYDPVRRRLWAVCEGCHRWNLCRVEEREGALYELERVARDHTKVLAQTANITLLHAGGLTLIRVGEAGLVEQAWRRSRDYPAELALSTSVATPGYRSCRLHL